MYLPDHTACFKMREKRVWDMGQVYEKQTIWLQPGTGQQYLFHRLGGFKTTQVNRLRQAFFAC